MNDRYFQWLIKKVANDTTIRRYSYLLEHLYNTPFTYILPLDENRLIDGIELRDIYRDEKKWRYGFQNSYCSVLEMMVALARRAEIHIMDNPDYGNRTDIWFWKMIESLGLADQTNDHYNHLYVADVIDRFLNRKYAASGKGGLFTIPNCKVDLRTVEIWWQMNWYMTWYLKEEGEL